MSEEIDLDAPDREFGWLIGGANIAVLLGGVAFFVFHKGSAAAPPQSLAGCYMADHAPPLKLSGDRLTVEQAGFKSLQFHIEWTKTVPMLIVIDPVIAIGPMDDGRWQFHNDPGHFSRIYPAHRVNGKIYGVLQPSDREFIAADDDAGVAHVFKPAPMSACGGL